jgi:NAD(P)-dependent dehydrogenase (short-subunit alcohol dehydrogenase family)
VSDGGGSTHRASQRRRVAAVTGSASGIGAAVRARLERDGWDVIGVDLAGQEVEADLSTPAGRAAAVTGVLELAPKVRRSTRPALEAVVACAGLGPQVERRDRLVSVNYFGAVAVLDGLLDALAYGGTSSAVAICSNSISVTPMPDPRLVELMLADDEAAAIELAPSLDGPTVYAMTKLALGRALRRRVQVWADHGVRLNLVAPGPVHTPLFQGTLDDPVLGPLVGMLPVPMGRPSEPDEIAGPIAFLLSPESAMIHGSVLFIDGGSDALLRSDHV